MARSSSWARASRVLHDHLPADAHLRCSGVTHIAITTANPSVPLRSCVPSCRDPHLQTSLTALRFAHPRLLCHAFVCDLVFNTHPYVGQVEPQDGHVRVSVRWVDTTRAFTPHRATDVQMLGAGKANQLVDDFVTRDDLIDALCTSSHIPLYSAGTAARSFRGTWCMDGGLSDFLPAPPTHAASYTARICCFPSQNINLVRTTSCWLACVVPICLCNRVSTRYRLSANSTIG